MRRAEIIQLALRHTFYADGRCPDFAIEPSDDTARLLRNHRCLLGTNADVVHILTQLDDSGQPFLPIPAGTLLRFQLRLQNGDFPYFTDLTAINAQAAPLFTNAGASAGVGGNLSLSSDPAGAPRRAAGVLADVELRVDSPPSGSALQLVSYSVAFLAKQMRWAYYCLTDLAPSADQLKIVDASPVGTTDVLQFGDANRTPLTEHPDPADAIAAQLASRYPTLRCVRLISDQTVACRQQPRTFLELRNGDERLLGPLPNPSLRNASREDLLFRIVKYRSQPFQNP